MRSRNSFIVAQFQFVLLNTPDSNAQTGSSPFQVLPLLMHLGQGLVTCLSLCSEGREFGGGLVVYLVQIAFSNMNELEIATTARAVADDSLGSRVAVESETTQKFGH